MDTSRIIESLLKRTTNGRYGIGTADRYFRSIESCFEGGFCPTKLFNSATQEQWQTALKAAEATLVYCDEDMNVGEFRKDGPVGLTSGAVLDFDAIVTTTSKDRDGDILEASGAKLDPRAPLLWQHIPIEPIGKLIAETKRNGKRIEARLSIIDSELGRDAAQLVEFGALRISHGFRPFKFDPIEGKDEDGMESGWHIREFEIMEVSLVSVPSNVEAVITAFSRDKLHSPLIKGWAEREYNARPSQVTGTGPFSHSYKAGDLEMSWTAPDADSLRKVMDMTLEDKGEPGTPIQPSQPVQPVIPVPPGGGTTPQKPKATVIDASNPESLTEGQDSLADKNFAGSTGESSGHSHTVNLDDDGNGSTGTSDGHKHAVIEFDVREADGHKHTLDQGDLEERTAKLKEDPLDVETKRGRVLSAKNEESLRDAVEELGEALKIADTPRATKALIHSAKNSISGVLKQMTGEESQDASIEKQLADIVVANTDQARELQWYLEALIREREAGVVLELLGV